MNIPDLLRAQAARVNALELAKRRDYHAYLLSRGESSETLEQHIEKYASLASLAPPAAEADLARLQTICPIPLPMAWLHFYRAVGGFHGGVRLQNAVIHAPADLLRAVERPANSSESLRTLGLVDMVRWSWGNDRFEFDPASGEGLESADVDALNARYAIFGWRVVEGEAFEYLYADHAGGCGRLFYHQDAFDELFADDLHPMLTNARPAPETFDQALRGFIEAALGSSFPDD